MSEIEQLLLEREIARVLARYARLADERDWDAIGEVFSEESSADYGGWALPDRAAIARMLRSHLGGCGPTQHLLGNLVVDAHGERVTSRVSVRAAHRGSGELSDTTYECLGEYHDRWVRTKDGWRIAQRRMVVQVEFGSRRVLR